MFPCISRLLETNALFFLRQKENNKGTELLWTFIHKKYIRSGEVTCNCVITEMCSLFIYSQLAVIFCLNVLLKSKNPNTEITIILQKSLNHLYLRACIARQYALLQTNKIPSKIF